MAKGKYTMSKDGMIRPVPDKKETEVTPTSRTKTLQQNTMKIEVTVQYEWDPTDPRTRQPYAMANQFAEVIEDAITFLEEDRGDDAIVKVVSVNAEQAPVLTAVNSGSFGDLSYNYAKDDQLTYIRNQYIGQTYGSGGGGSGYNPNPYIISKI